MTNDELLEAWRRKLPNVEPTDRELSAFALGVEIGADALDAAERERDRLDAALRASCIDAREELREMGGGCSRAVAAEAERDAFAALLRKAREFIDTTRDPPYPAGADLADRIDAALAAREPT